jgi:hypothetical protein
MPTDPVHIYRGVLIYEETKREAEGELTRLFRCHVNDSRIEANTVEALKR